MDCPYCDYSKTHKHGKTSKGTQRYKCAHCHRSFVETFDTLYYWRQVSADEVEKILQSQAEGAVYGALVASITSLQYRGEHRPCSGLSSPASS